MPVPLLVALAVAASLAGLVYAELAAPATILPTAIDTRAPMATMPSHPTASEPAMADDLLARPLFAPGRRPAAIDQAAPAATETDIPPRLAGTLVTGRQSRIALLAVATSPALQAVHEGDQLGRYRVVQIGPGTVVIDGPAGPVTMRMDARPVDRRVQAVRIEAAHNAVGAPDQDE